MNKTIENAFHRVDFRPKRVSSVASRTKTMDQPTCPHGCTELTHFGPQGHPAHRARTLVSVQAPQNQGALDLARIMTPPATPTPSTYIQPSWKSNRWELNSELATF